MRFPLKNVSTQLASYFLSVPLLWGLASGGCTGTNPDQAGMDTDMAMSIDAAVPPGDSDGGADLASVPDADAGALLTAACNNLATAICNKLASCSSYYTSYFYGDTKTCVERVKLTCAPYVKLNGSSWTIDRLQACAGAYTAGTCDDYFAPGGPAACRPQPGKLKDGSVCANGNQCQSALCNLGVSGCGTCVTPAKKGAACTAALPCELGLSCVAGKCASEGALGSACGLNQPACKTGLYCKAAACAAQLAVGAACDPNGTVTECNPIQGLYCDTATRRCAAYKVVRAGEACGTVMGATVLCGAGGSCTSTGTNRKCVAAAADGMACGPASGSTTCMSPANCSSSLCQVFDPASCK